MRSSRSVPGLSRRDKSGFENLGNAPPLLLSLFKQMFLPGRKNAKDFLRRKMRGGGACTLDLLNAFEGWKQELGRGRGRRRRFFWRLRRRASFFVSSLNRRALPVWTFNNYNRKGPSFPFSQCENRQISHLATK